MLLDTTYLAVLFFFDFVTCPCSFRTKRHDNLFVYDDDDVLYCIVLYWCEFVSVVATVQELSRSTEVVATNGAKMPAVVVLAHSLRHFSQQAVREISEQSATPLSNDDIRWVVTVPAIWTAAAKQLMRQSAYDVSVCDPSSLCP